MLGKNEQSDFDHLVDLCEKGMLYEAEEWLAAGHVATKPEGTKRCPLKTAAEMGFHSLVKLLLHYDCTDSQKLSALEKAAEYGGMETCKLIVEAGAPVDQLHHEHLDYVIRRPLIEYLLDHGLDLTMGNGLANLFVYRRVKPLLGIFLNYREKFPEWEEQAAMALFEFIRKKDKKWISLMIWAKADPLLPVCELSDIPYDPEDDGWRWSAFELATHSGDMEIYRMLKAKPSPDQATQLLFSIWEHPPPFVVADLLSAGAEVDTYTTEEGSLLHKALLSFARRWDWSTRGATPEEDAEMISWLIERKAKWRPPEGEREVNYLRRKLYTQEGRLVVKILRWLFEGNCCELSLLRELVDMPKMRGWIQEHDRELFDLLEM